MAALRFCFSAGFVQRCSPTPAPVNQPQTARITKGARSAPRASLWKAILKLTCLLFVGSKVKLLTLPSIPPVLLSPLCPGCTVNLIFTWIRVLSRYIKELVHSQRLRSSPCCPSGHIIQLQTMTIL